jgi:hypothetical protein
LGALESRLVVHVVGITDVRVETTQTLSAQTVHMVKELTRGPVR